MNKFKHLLLLWLAFAFVAGVGAACSGLITTPLKVSPILSPSLFFTSMPVHSPTVSITQAALKTEPPTSSPTATLTQTEIPTIPQTLEPSFSPTPTATIPRWLLPTWTPRPTLTPTITPTPTPPNAYLQLNNPGEMSKVSSPIQLEAQITPGEDGLVYIDLIGEDGRYIVHDVLDFRRYLNRQIDIVPEIEFKIPRVSEIGRLVLSVEDENKRKIAVSSVDIILLAMGRDELNSPIHLLESYLIRYPIKNQVVQGGNLVIQVLARPYNDQPLIIEVIDEKGVVIASKQVKVPPPNGNLSHTPFTETINYRVSTLTPVRLTIRQESSNRIPGTVALTSLQIYLEP